MKDVYEIFIKLKNYKNNNDKAIKRVFLYTGINRTR